MSVALAAVLLAVGALGALAGLRIRGGPEEDQFRGFCVVGAAGAVVVAVAVAVVGLFWDSRIADVAAIVALFALTVYYLAALAIGMLSRSRPGKRAPDPTAPPD